MHFKRTRSERLLREDYQKFRRSIKRRIFFNLLGIVLLLSPNILSIIVQ